MTTISSSIGSITFRGSKLPKNMRDACIGMSFSASQDQATQISMEFVDPNYSLLNSSKFDIGVFKSEKTKIEVRYQSFNLVVTNVATSEGPPAQLEVRARPLVIQKLKERTGTKTMTGVSPSEFVIAECKAVGAKYVVQSSPKRSNVTRDKPSKGQRYDRDQKPSSWTTFARLARELGYVCYEYNSIIYFGKPTWLLNITKKSGSVRVTTKSGNDRTRALQKPECSVSLGGEVTVDLKLPKRRFGEVRIGKALYLADVPKFKGYYIITGIDTQLSGDDAVVQVTAETAVDPTPEPPPAPASSSGSSGGGGSGGGGSVDYGRTYRGSRPISSRYPVGTPFGRKGSWAAGYHTGTDYPAPTGTPVYAVYDGTIVSSTWGGAYGNHVILNVPGMGRFAYCHLSRKAVSVGAKVKSGQTLGYVGATGRAFGSHLHLEFRLSPYGYGRDSRNPVTRLMQTKTAKGGSTSGVASGPTTAGGGVKRAKGYYNSKTVQGFVSAALTQVGDPYVWGAGGGYTASPSFDPRGFDCSGLVSWASRYAGVYFPAGTGNQWSRIRTKGTQISVSKAMNTYGALLFRNPYGAGGRQGAHVAISLGNGYVVEAANTRVGVVKRKSTGGYTLAATIPGLKGYKK